MPQPLAFTFVKTVVTARDERRDLAPPLSVAWAMVRDELGTSAAEVAGHVTWGPDHQVELRRLIDGVRDCLAEDAALEEEIATLLEDAQRLALLPDAPAGGTDGPAETQAVAEVTPEAPVAEPIPMIELGPEFIEADHSPTPATAPTPPTVPPPPPVAVPPSVKAPEPAELPTIRRDFDVAEALQPTPKAPVSKTLIALGVVGAIATVALLVYLASNWHGREAAVPPAPPTEDAAAETLAEPSTEAVAALAAAGSYSAARDAQLDYLVALDASAAPPAVRAGATARLAELFSLAEEPAKALEQQRRSLELAKDAYGEEAVEVADAHLDIVSYYLLNEEPRMADAHYRQGRKLLRGESGALTPARAERLQQLGDRLGIGE